MRKNKILEKLKSRRGESIAEVLVALLISSLALAMLAGLISASSKIVRNSMDTMEAYVDAENQFAIQETLSGNSPDGHEIKPVSETTGKVTFSADDQAVRLTDGNDSAVIDVEYYYEVLLRSRYVISYSASSEGD